MTNEETKMAVDVLSAPKKPIEVNTPTQPTTVTTPQPTKKEVKPVAEVKDPKGMFDYTGLNELCPYVGNKDFSQSMLILGHKKAPPRIEEAFQFYLINLLPLDSNDIGLARQVADRCPHR